jgi:hypothetical protein
MIWINPSSKDTGNASVKSSLSALQVSALGRLSGGGESTVAGVVAGGKDGTLMWRRQSTNDRVGPYLSVRTRYTEAKNRKIHALNPMNPVW